jgi:hypothetical protein
VGCHGENTHGSRSTFTKISKVAVMRRDWETRLSGELEHDSNVKAHAEISNKAVLEDKKEEPIPEKLEEVHTKTRTTPSIDFAKSNETNERSMSSAKPLREFEQMDWVPIDYGETTRGDRSLTKRGWQELWKWTSHRKGKQKIYTILKPPLRSFESSLVMMKWIRIIFLR